MADPGRFYGIVGHPRQVSGVGGLAALAKKEFWQARLHLTLRYHVIVVFLNKGNNFFLNGIPEWPPESCQ